HGWAWIPGRRYAGAWVDWTVHPSGYVGWSPAPPLWRWEDRRAVGITPPPPPPRTYVMRSHVFTPRLYDQEIHGSRAAHLDREAHVWTPPPGPTDRLSERPRVGPQPRDIGIDQNRLPPPPQNPGLTRAHELARPQITAPPARVAPMPQP